MCYGHVALCDREFSRHAHELQWLVGQAVPPMQTQVPGMTELPLTSSPWPPSSQKRGEEQRAEQDVWRQSWKRHTSLPPSVPWPEPSRRSTFLPGRPGGTGQLCAWRRGQWVWGLVVTTHLEPGSLPPVFSQGCASCVLGTVWMGGTRDAL